MKKSKWNIVITIVIITCLVFTTTIVSFGAEKNSVINDKMILFQRISKVQELNNLGIETYLTDDGKISLKHVTAKRIAHANEILAAKTNYPTL